MIDYINIECLKFSKVNLLNNELLNFGVELNEETGEIKKSNNYYIKKVATLENFKIELITNTINNRSKLNLKGSIHKYWNNGTNYNDFDLHSLKKALFDLFNKLDIDIQETRIHSIEFGVNINIPYSCYKFLNSIVSYKGKPPLNFDYRNKGQLIKFELEHYIIKIYNKGLQYYKNGVLPTNDDNLLRFEIHVDRMQYLTNKGIDISNVSDLFDISILRPLGTLLNNVFIDIVCYDTDIDLKSYKPKDKEFILNCKNPKYWSEIKNRKKPKELIRTKNKFKELIHSNTQTDISKIIQNKWEYLIKNVPLLPSVENRELSLYYTNIVGNNKSNTNKCIITGVDISKQKTNSRFLSEQSINEIQNNDIELYKTLYKKFAPRNKTGNINYLMAHNIRNNKFNSKHNFLRKYKNAISQTTLFNINEVIKLTDTQREYLNSY
jgi:hypothetical protein